MIFRVGLRGDGRSHNDTRVETAQIFAERRPIGGGEIGERGHAAGDITPLEECAQLLRVIAPLSVDSWPVRAL